MDRNEKKILTSASIYHASNDASVVTLPAVFPVLYTQGVLIRRYSDIGTILLTGLVVAVIAQFIIGHSIKAKHYRCCLALSALVLGVFLILMASSKSFLTLLVFFIGVRIGSSVYHPVGISWISKVFKGKKLDRAMGIQSAFGDIGVLSAFVATGYLTDRFGWKVPLLLWGSVNLTALWVGLLVSRGTEFGTREETEQRSVSWLETFSDLKPFIPPLMLGGIAWGITLGYAPSLLNHKLHLSMSETGVILGSWMAMGTLASLFYGKIAERLERSKIIIIAYSLIALATVAIGISTRTHFTIIAFLIYGIALFTTFPALLSFVGSTTRAHNRTATFSTVSNIQILGNSIFSYISGFLSDAYGINIPFIVLGLTSALVVIYIAAMMKKSRLWQGEAPEFMRGGDIESI